MGGVESASPADARGSGERAVGEGSVGVHPASELALAWRSDLGRYEPSPAEWEVWNRHRQQMRAEAENGLSVKEALAYIRHPNWRWHGDQIWGGMNPRPRNGRCGIGIASRCARKRRTGCR